MKRNFVSARIAIVLSILMVISAMASPMMAFAAPQAADPGGNESFKHILGLYPEFWDAKEGVTQPIFQFNDHIQEQVYVEVPVDSDEDGKRDLVKVSIYRPAESGKNGIKVPVLLHHTPYLHGSGGISNLSHVVDIRDDIPETTHYTYEDVKTKQVQAYDWPWTDEAFEVEDPVFGTISVPASRGDKPNPEGLTGAPITVQPGGRPTAGSWKSYLMTRGYAMAISGVIGTRYSEGIPSSCDVDEALAAMAVIKWFAGEARGYTDLDATVQVKATDWCNGNVAMEGTSYPGTTPILAATSGVKNLKAIFPKAAVPNWYTYYRENGAVHNPDLYAGEDALKHADYNFSRKADASEELLALANEKFEDMLVRADRDSGSYNEFWDQRNMLRNVHLLQEGREDDPVGVIIQHGWNDHNVLPKMSDQLYRAIKINAPLVPVKIWWHTQVHADGQLYGGLLDWTHKWLDHFLYGVDNNVVNEMPDTSIVSNIDGKFERFDSWPIPGSEYQRLYFRPAPEGSGAGTLAFNAPAEKITESLRDDLEDYTTAVNQMTGGNYQTYAGNWERRALLGWDGSKPNLEAENINRLAYVSEPLTEDLRLNGVPKITLNVTPDKAKGYISAAIVEIGPSARPYAYGDSSGRAITIDGKSYPAVPNGSALASGPSRQLEVGGGISNKVTVYDSYATNQNNISEYKFVVRAMTNVRKPNPSGKIYTDAADTSFIPEYYYQEQDIEPGKAYSYTFGFGPMDYTFKAGQRIAVLVYSTDYRHSNITDDVTTLTVDLSKSYVDIPFVNNTLKDIGLDVALSMTSGNIKVGDKVDVEANLTQKVEGNVAILDFVFDKTKFAVEEVSVPDGLNLVLEESSNKGHRVVVMSQNYELLDLVSLKLKAITNIGATDGIIGVGVNIVQRDAEGNKEVIVLSSALDYDPVEEIDKVDIITLSDAIDAFGKDKFSYDWAQVRKYDLNNNGVIDISDIAILASKIK